MVDEDELPSLPPLGPGFALFGAAAGFFAVLLFGAAHFGSRQIHPVVAAASAGLVGALFGALLRRSKPLRRPFISRGNVLLRLGTSLGLSGALAGLILSAVTVLIHPNGSEKTTVIASTLSGAFVGLLLLPACAAVFSASVRAVRSRPGSVVSGVDRGRVELTLFTTLSLFAIAGLPAVGLGATSFALGPFLQTSVSIGVPLVCVAFCLLIVRRGTLAARAVDALSARLETCDPAEASDESAPAVSDLGLGDERWSEVRPGQAYRGARVAAVVLRGNVDDARHAIQETKALGRLALGVALAVTALVSVAGSVLLIIDNQAWVELTVSRDVARFPADTTPVWVSPTPPMSRGSFLDMAESHADRAALPEPTYFRTRPLSVSF